tara:strand:- start:36386 stop:37120 length:735 start_codon:yes stop_codon:yes gene_type:complete
MVREIKIFSTLTRKKLDTDASTWGELQTHLRKEGVRFENMKVAIGKSKLMLEHPQAELPAEPFTLYLMPTKTKSGGYTKEDIEDMSYDELRDAVRNLVMVDGENADNHFNGEIHYTHKKKDALQTLLTDWFFMESSEEEGELVSPSDNGSLNGKISQDFITATITEPIEKGFLTFVIEQLENFQTDKDHIANVVLQVIQMLKQATDDWSTEEVEYQNLINSMPQEEEYHEEDSYEEDSDNDFGY